MVERALEQYDSRETLRVLALRTTFLLVWGARVALGFYVAGPQSCSLVRLWTTRSTCCTPTSSQIRSGPAWTPKSHDSPEDLRQQEKLRRRSRSRAWLCDDQANPITLMTAHRNPGGQCSNTAASSTQSTSSTPGSCTAPLSRTVHIHRRQHSSKPVPWSGCHIIFFTGRNK